MILTAVQQTKTSQTMTAVISFLLVWSVLTCVICCAVPGVPTKALIACESDNFVWFNLPSP